MGTVFLPVSEMRKLRHREAVSFAPCYTAREERQGQNAARALWPSLQRAVGTTEIVHVGHVGDAWHVNIQLW